MNDPLEPGACLMNWSQVCFVVVHAAELELVLSSGHRVRLPRTGEPATAQDIELMIRTQPTPWQALAASVAAATPGLLG